MHWRVPLPPHQPNHFRRCLATLAPWWQYFTRDPAVPTLLLLTDGSRILESLENSTTRLPVYSHLDSFTLGSCFLTIVCSRYHWQNSVILDYEENQETSYTTWIRVAQTVMVILSVHDSITFYSLSNNKYESLQGFKEGNWSKSKMLSPDVLELCDVTHFSFGTDYRVKWDWKIVNMHHLSLKIVWCNGPECAAHLFITLFLFTYPSLRNFFLP